ncbi:hypothetical protein FOA52_007427 [Chlamydomonas sp. UWO 241]|nr:hypothetical protein FOA52_007427 [Chlamydomonas sp. UWO 241]
MANESKEGCKLLSLVWEKMQASAARDLSLKEAEMQMSALTDAAKRRREAVELAEKAVAQLEAIVATERRECEAAKAKRDAEAPETPELLATVKAPPTDVEAVKELIREKEQELDQIVCTNPNIMREYQQRHTTIEGLQKTVSEADAVLASMQADMSATREKWLPELMKIVETINTSFSANFAEIGCAGEVVLHEASIAAEKYKECALEIRVQFRETESLEVLNIHRQSGGERSVSTVLFLIALQGVTVTPFRVIDEINQGMDPINERKVFTQLVASACRPDTPQCFLLTPKLLPGLHFTPDITILQIMNGPHIHTNLPEKFANAAVAMYGRRAAALVA